MAFVFDKKACIIKLDEVGKKVSAYIGRPGYDVAAWLKTNVTPLDYRLNVKNETSEDLYKAIMALPSAPSPVVSPAAKAPSEPAKTTEPTKVSTSVKK